MKTYDQIEKEISNDAPRMNIIVGHPNYRNLNIVDFIGNLGISNVKYYNPNSIDFYSSWYKNNHHWTTKFVWTNVFPVILDFLNVCLKENDFETVTKFSGSNDITYHKYNNVQLHFYDIDDGIELNGNHDALRDFSGKYDFQRKGDLTDYHHLFVGSHRNSQIITENPKTSSRVLLISDSMAIPIIPLIVPYVKELLIVDNHNSKLPYSVISEFKPSHLLTLNTIWNFMTGNVKRKMEP